MTIASASRQPRSQPGLPRPDRRCTQKAKAPLSTRLPAFGITRSRLTDRFCFEWWNGDPSRGWQKLEGVSFPPGAFVLAIPSGPNRQFVLAVGTDGNVHVNEFSGNWSGWRKVHVNLASSPSFVPGQHITPNLAYLVAKDGFIRHVDVRNAVANKIDQ